MPTSSPQILSTWSFGAVGNRAAWAVLERGGPALDAVVAGATAVEDDPTVDSVGIGGFPDADGRVSLDACVMTDPAHCGSVCYVRGYPHVTQIARAVMDKTIHVMLAGDGAEQFAAAQGFVKDPNDLLTSESRQAFAEYQRQHGAERARVGLKMGIHPPMNVEERYQSALGIRDSAFEEKSLGQHTPPMPGHDTVCLLARDAAGTLAGACTTSGVGFKIPGRVGDSPIIGHGLYVEQGVGGASATGNGELIMGVCGSFLAVELMRQGREPIEAASEVIRRIIAKYTLVPNHQIGVIVMRADGAWASAALRDGFTASFKDHGGEQVISSKVVI